MSYNIEVIQLELVMSYGGHAEVILHGGHIEVTYRVTWRSDHIQSG